MPVIGRQIHVRGRVQGVGFRPYVWRLARGIGLTGQVRNDATGVRIDVWGSSTALDDLLDRLHDNLPPLARIDTVKCAPLETAAPTTDFKIAPSEAGTVSTEIAPDASTCAACLTEIRDPQDRRHRYPFTNCTHCGPRLSIVESIPYDREATSMRIFAMCNDCRREYDDPTDRRFHAQPNACPACGPKLWVEDKAGDIACDDPLMETTRLLRHGSIVAIKGIGGFHLACDATNAAAVTELRRRKQRPVKPLAVMAKNVDDIRRYCHVSEQEERLLASPAAPIVLLRNRSDASLPGIAPGLTCTGFMLPYSPLHHLLLDALDRSIVLTSGNAPGTPQIICNNAARAELEDIADAWLLHDRAIVNRLDDSVVRVDLGAPFILRRSRGLAPEELRLSEHFEDTPPTLALGAELKSTFCLLENGSAIPSQHIGDLKNAETFADFRAKLDLFRDLFRFEPVVIAVDRHPDYLSTRWGHTLAQETGARLTSVQHHHAHLVSCLAEHSIAHGDDLAVGIILDGTGLGTDGTIWGGELLVGGYGGFERRAHFAPVALPGGEQAIHEPWRNTVAHLSTALGPDWRRSLERTDLGVRLTSKPVRLITQLIESGVNAPPATSAGRLFDAVAGAIGIAFDRQNYEGQAAMELEAVAADHISDAGNYQVDLSMGVFSFESLWTALLEDLGKGVNGGIIAARFHNGLASALATAASSIASDASTNRVVLSGGVMQNRLLLERLHARLTAEGLEVLIHRRVPSNDGGISLGQAAIAALS